MPNYEKRFPEDSELHAQYLELINYVYRQVYIFKLQYTEVYLVRGQPFDFQNNNNFIFIQTYTLAIFTDIFKKIY
jgi:hypothetical protein